MNLSYYESLSQEHTRGLLHIVPRSTSRVGAEPRVLVLFLPCEEHPELESANRMFLAKLLYDFSAPRQHLGETCWSVEYQGRTGWSLKRGGEAIRLLWKHRPFQDGQRSLCPSMLERAHYTSMRRNVMTFVRTWLLSVPDMLPEEDMAGFDALEVVKYVQKHARKDAIGYLVEPQMVLGAIHTIIAKNKAAAASRATARAVTPMQKE